MSVCPELRSLEIDIPAQPEALVKLSLLLADDEINLQAASVLVETDMALAAAVLKAVNSSLYGLKGRVQSVQQAVTYLGMREVVAITFEVALRAAFPHASDLEPLWARAGRRGWIMGRLGAQLAVDAWAAHSAGLFEECGKAVLFRHARSQYLAMMRMAPSDAELSRLEHESFGVSHEALGAALCESWGLGAPAVASVRYHVVTQATLEVPPQVPKKSICGLSVIAHMLMNDPDRVEEAVARIAPQADIDPLLALRGTRRLQEQLAQAALLEHG
jgi:HD-like signal output (HDOD) protein